MKNLLLCTVFGIASLASFNSVVGEGSVTTISGNNISEILSTCRNTTTTTTKTTTKTTKTTKTGKSLEYEE